MKTKYNRTGIIKGWLLVATLVTVTACEDFVQIDPPKNELVRETVFESDATAQAAMRGLYTDFFQSPFGGGSGGINTLGGLCSDDLFFRLTTLDNYLQLMENSLEASNGIILNSWNYIYRLIYHANGILEGLENSSVVSASVKDQLAGEAKFIRAFCYFHLVNLWSDVPLVLTTDYRVNMSVERTPVSLIYNHILADLTDAETLLREDYSISGGERVRVNKWGAKAMLARVHLFLGEWSHAETKSTEVINHTSVFSLRTNLDEVFLKNSTEAIWQLFAIQPTIDTWDGQTYLPSTPATSVTNVPLTIEFVNSFESGDARLTNWVDSKVVGGVNYFYPTKYKIRNIPAGTPHTEYSVVLRLSEQYLIRAEARVKLGNVTGVNSAESDTNTIRTRAGLPNTTATTQEEMVLAIEQERRFELFSEGGHRWFDLIRTGRANAVLSPIKADWQDEDVLWPIPQTERNLNPNLGQNPGY